MQIKSFIKIVTAVTIFSIYFSVYSQQVPENKETPKEILIKIQTCFEDGDISRIAPYLSSKTYLSISEEVSGYFSYSQSFNLISEYFEVHKPLNLRFASMVDTASAPFAWGTYKYLKNGIRGEHKVFVSLQQNESFYFISQITIN